MKPQNTLQKLQGVFMIREEYLNPEYMYKFINALCRTDNWKLTDFQFGRLEYKTFEQPGLMYNKYGYNMVYKCEIYRLPTEPVHFGEKYSGNIEVSQNILKKQLDYKTIYFDIRNECFAEHDNNVASFKAYPAFFSMDNQVYYGIYNQPRVMRHHRSRAREMECLSEYMKEMNATAHNIFTINELLYNTRSRGSFLAGFPDWTSLYDNRKQANKAVVKLVTGEHDCKKYKKLTSLDRPTDEFKLPLHQDNVPHFYTNNVLELTLPIAESVYALADKVHNSLRSIENSLYVLGSVTYQTMVKQVDLLRLIANFDGKTEYFDRTNLLRLKHDCFLEDESFGGGTGYFDLYDHYPLTATVFQAQQKGQKLALKAPQEVEVCKNVMDTSFRSIKSSMEGYNELLGEINKLRTAPPSLDRMLEISNAIKVLKNKQAWDKLNAAKEK